jgi:hypothetical protein
MITHFSTFAPIAPIGGGAPSIPSGFSASAIGTSQINLSWTVSSGATGYNIYRDTSQNGSFPRVGNEPTIASGDVITYSDTSLSAGTTYYYKIAAINISGESAASSAISAITNNAVSSGGGVSGGSGGGGGGGRGILTPILNVIFSQNNPTPVITKTTVTPATSVKTAPQKKIAVFKKGLPRAMVSPVKKAASSVKSKITSPKTKVARKGESATKTTIFGLLKKGIMFILRKILFFI